jgi:hypothetical protein
VATTNARDELLDRLLGVPLDRFVEERNRLAREARAAGDRDTASWLASLRRPAPHVWAVDQLARNDPRGMLGLTNLARRLADAQSRAVQDRDAAREMQELSRELRRAIDGAVRRGIGVLRDAGHGVSAEVVMSMANTLRGALAGGDDAREQVEKGRLLAPPGESDFGFGQAGTAFGDVASAGATADDAPTAHSRSAAARPTPDAAAAQRLEERRAQAAAAADAASAAERELFRRKTDQRRADEQVTAARTRVQELQAELSAAEEEARAAAERVRDAVEAARAARREADRLESALPPD